MTLLCVALAAATPSTRLAVETMPSLAPNTAARDQPMRVGAVAFTVARCHLRVSLRFGRWRTIEGEVSDRHDVDEALADRHVVLATPALQAVGA
jgi:hypothetical protein